MATSPMIPEDDVPAQVPDRCQCGAPLERRLLADVDVWATRRDWNTLSLQDWVRRPQHDVHVLTPGCAPALVHGRCRQEATR